MIELYEYPPTRSQRAKWVLEELGASYSSRTVVLHDGEQNTPDYRAVHPLGFVPALRTGDYTIFESVAIVLQLIDEYPSAGLAPPCGSVQRAHYYQWSIFACAELDPALMMFFDNTLRPLEACDHQARNTTRHWLSEANRTLKPVPKYSPRRWMAVNIF